MNLSTMLSKCCAALVLSLLCVSAADAKKPDKPGGGKPGGGGGGDDPTAAEQNPAIAFVSSATNGRTDVVVASADLSSEIVLTSGLQLRKKDGYRLFGSPAWSWDGTSVAFWAQDVRDGVWSAMKLYIAAADGSGVVLVRDFSTRPSFDGPDYVSSGLNWSWSGQELVYHDQQKLVSIDAVSGDTRVLLDGIASTSPTADPSLSPDLDPAPGYQGRLATVGAGPSAGAPDVFMVPIADDAGGYLLPVDGAAFSNVTDSPAQSVSPFVVAGRYGTGDVR